MSGAKEGKELQRRLLVYDCQWAITQTPGTAAARSGEGAARKVLQQFSLELNQTTATRMPSAFGENQMVCLLLRCGAHRQISS